MVHDHCPLVISLKGNTRATAYFVGNQATPILEFQKVLNRPRATSWIAGRTDLKEDIPMKKFVSVIALVGFGLATAQTGFILPTIPNEIAAPEGQKVTLTALGRGTQNYACQANAAKTGFEWAFKAPEERHQNRLALRRSNLGSPRRLEGRGRSQSSSRQPQHHSVVVTERQKHCWHGFVRQDHVHSAPIHHWRFSAKHRLRCQYGWQRGKNELHRVVRVF
jgi:hypothetical protein